MVNHLICVKTMNDLKYRKKPLIRNRLISAYFVMWKAYLYLRKALILFEIRWKKIKAFYLLKLYLAYSFSWKSRATLLEYKKNYEAVIKICQKKLNETDETNTDERAEIYETIGRNQRNLSRINEAYSSFQYAQKFLNSKSPSLHYEMGLIHFMKRNYILARHCLETAIRKGYDTALLRIHLGKVYYQMGLLTRAADCFKRVLNVYPREGSLYFLLGIVHKSKVEYHLAIEAFKNAIKYGSDQKEEHLGLAEIYTRLGYWDEAIREYKQVLEFDPDNFIAHYFLGWIYDIQGLDDEAIQEYLLANKINPDDEDTKQKLTQILASPVTEEYF